MNKFYFELNENGDVTGQYSSSPKQGWVLLEFDPRNNIDEFVLKDGVLVYSDEKASILRNEVLINEYLRELSQTDWYSTRFLETGKEIPNEVLERRKWLRNEISLLRGV